MTDTPYGVTGCLCWLTSTDGHAVEGHGPSTWTETYTPNASCPYHGLLPRDRTDTGVYRVIRLDTGTEIDAGIGTPDNPISADTANIIDLTLRKAGKALVPPPKKPDPDSLDDRLRRGIEQAERGETIDRGDYTAPDIDPVAYARQQRNTCGHPLIGGWCRECARDRATDTSAGLNARLAPVDGPTDYEIAHGIDDVPADYGKPGSLEWFAEERRRRDDARGVVRPPWWRRLRTWLIEALGGTS